MQDFNCETLLVFAHRAEASAFLEGASAVPYLFEGLHSHPEFGLILICGEGLWSLREKLSSVLTTYQKILSVINLGVCGALREGFAAGEIYSIRTVYAESEFKSFTSNKKTAQVDCISAKERVLRPEVANELDNFAPLVERELWSIAYVCELFKKPWTAYKLVSDKPFETSESVAICETVKESAQGWSLKLKEKYLLESTDVSDECNLQSNFIPSELTINYHLTTSTQRQLQTFIQKLGQDRVIQLLEDFSSQQYPRPKERTSALISALSRELNPFRAKLEDKIQVHTNILNENGIQVSYPWPLENAHLNLKFQIQSGEDINKLTSALQKFSFEEFKQLVDEGRLDV